MDFAGRGILLDIEGTTSSVRFVYDVMFPFARRELPGFLDAHWSQPAVMAACHQIAIDAGHASLDDWCGGKVDVAVRRQRLCAEVERLMDADAKATGLKQLQGLIWQAGFESGEMRAHVYEDVPPALAAWQIAGIDVRIYSSGSIQAQRLFFAHSIAGDLLPFFRGHYDTTFGSKRESASYERIMRDISLPPGDVLFVSDVVAELDAARAAGLRTALCLRPGNTPVASGHGHPELRQFSEIQLRPA
jgi:enolase-phosphatase E1